MEFLRSWAWREGRHLRDAHRRRPRQAARLHAAPRRRTDELGIRTEARPCVIFRRANADLCSIVSTGRLPLAAIRDALTGRYEPATPLITGSDG